MVRTAAKRRPHQIPDGETILASQNLILRPAGQGVAFIQLDDLDVLRLPVFRGMRGCWGDRRFWKWLKTTWRTTLVNPYRQT